jgi:N-methylhydantoinase B
LDHCFFGYDPQKGKNFIVQSIEGGGWGGRPFEDGESASVSICQGDVRNAPIENIELKCPVIVEERVLRQDSGGAGKFRGGLGLDSRVSNLVEGRWNLMQTGRRNCPPWGLWGGRSGGASDYLLRLPEQSEWQSVDVALHPVPNNSGVIIRTAGGGGWGNPLERDPQKVRMDVLEGFVSLEAARNQYGVVLRTGSNPFVCEVDEEATKKLSKKMKGVIDVALLDELVAFISRHFEGLSPETVQQAKLHIIDSLGAVLAGVALGEGKGNAA